MSNDITAMKDKIAKLLAKADGTDNEAERDTYTAHAEKLMVKLGIDKAELEAAGTVKADPIVEERRTYKGQYAIVMIPFFHSVASGFGDLTVLQAGRGNQRTAYVIGHKTDVEMFLQLMTSLENQAMAALHAWQKVTPLWEVPRGPERLRANKSFLTAFGYTVSRRLRASRKEATQEATVSAGAELVLASKMDRVQSYMDDHYSNLRASRTGSRSWDSRGAAGGRAAGERANIGGTSIGGGRGQLS